MEKILIVEDDPEISMLTECHFRDLGIETDAAADGPEGLEKALNNDYDLVILDVMLPNMSGTEICREIRSQDRHMPILFLTSKSEEIDKVVGLELGADDYVTKPFGTRELEARVKALLRRGKLVAKSAPVEDIFENGLIEAGPFQIDLSRRVATKNGEEIDLTRQELDVLAFLASEPGRVFDRHDLLEHVWGLNYEGYQHTVTCCIQRLRAKVEEKAAEPVHIITVRGVGFKFELGEA